MAKIWKTQFKCGFPADKLFKIYCENQAPSKACNEFNLHLSYTITIQHPQKAQKMEAKMDEI